MPIRLPRFVPSQVPSTCAIALGVWSAIAGPVHAEGPQSARVAIVFGHQHTYRQAAQALQRSLEAAGLECVAAELPKSGESDARDRLADLLATPKPTVIASAGAPATVFALQAFSDVPVVFFMVPNMVDAAFIGEDNPHRSRLAGVAADVSPDDRMEWIKRLHPACRNIAVLHSFRTKRTAEALSAAARRRGMTVKSLEADRQRFPDAIKALNNSGCDGVLMIPDAKVYNAPNVRRLLLWGIRQKKPVWAFSKSVVKAGALAGQYSDAESVGRQAAGLIQEVLAGADAASIGPRYPRRVLRAVNERTADMIRVRLPSGAVGADTARYGDQQ